MRHSWSTKHDTPLTPRQRTILILAAHGLGRKQIARRLRISPHTVKHHLETIADRLDTHRVSQAVVYAMERGWIHYGSWGEAMSDLPRAVNYAEMLTKLSEPSTIPPDELSACEREVLRLMRETVKRQRGRATFVVEFIGSAWHVLECSPPRHVKL